MKLTITAAIILLSCVMTAGCASSKKAAGESSQDNASLEVIDMAIPGKMLGGETAALPRATVYKTNGNFNDNVPVTLSADRKEIISFPAPGDISPESAPLPLAEGYLLDRRGISANSAFTRYTYESYAALKEVPSLKLLKESIIQGAEVVDIVILPMTLTEAENDTTRCNTIIRNGFPECDTVLHRLAIQLTPQ